MLMSSPDIENKVVPELSRHPYIRRTARFLVKMFNTTKFKGVFGRYLFRLVDKAIEHAPQPSPNLHDFRKQVASEFKRGISERR